MGHKVEIVKLCLKFMVQVVHYKYGNPSDNFIFHQIRVCIYVCVSKVTLSLSEKRNKNIDIDSETSLLSPSK